MSVIKGIVMGLLLICGIVLTGWYFLIYIAITALRYTADAVDAALEGLYLASAKIGGWEES